MGKGKGEAPQVQRWGAERKPTLGGISFYIVFLFCLSLSYGPYLNGEEEGVRMMGLLGAGSLAFIMGLSDDVYETRPFLKLAVQAACGFIFLLTGSHLVLPGPEWVGGALTLLWVILLMNSFNMVDNMDGIAASIALTVLAGSVLRLGTMEASVMSLCPVLLGLFAAVAAFLYYNIHPSSMFMGDAGTQFLGLLLAFFSIHLFWTPVEAYRIESSWVLLYKGSALLLLFWSSLVDTATVLILRIARGGSPLKGGKDHTTHAFSYAGLSERKINLLYFLWNALNVLLALAVIRYEASLFPALLVLAYILITFVAILLHTQRNYLKERSPV